MNFGVPLKTIIHAETYYRTSQIFDLFSDGYFKEWGGSTLGTSDFNHYNITRM